MPGPGDLMAQIQAKKQLKQTAAATAGVTSADAGPSALLAALQLKKQQTGAGELGHRTQDTQPKKLEAVKKAKAFRVGDAPFSFDASLDAFLFFAANEQPSSFAPTCVVDNTITTITIPLAPCVYRMTDYTLAKQEPIELERCVQKLGVLRCLALSCQTLNQLLAQRFNNNNTNMLEETELGKTRFMELLSGTGVYQKVSELILQQAGKVADYYTAAAKATDIAATENKKGPVIRVCVEQLDELLVEIERLEPSLARARTEITQTAQVSFYPGLGELFCPGSMLVSHPVGMEGSPLGCSCVQSWYDQELNKATNKIKRRFILVVEFIVSVGDELVFVAASDVYPEFHDLSRNAPMKDLKHRRLFPEANADDAALMERMQQRGEFYASVATKNHFLEYYADSFFPIIGGGWNSNAVRPLSKGGRVMVDVKRGILEGHLPVRTASSSAAGDDGMADTVKEAIKLFEQSKRTGVAVPFRTAILPEFDNDATRTTQQQHHDPSAAQQRGDSDRHHLWQAWPMLTGFSFTARVWGKLLLGMPNAPKPASCAPGSRPTDGPAHRPSMRKLGVELAALGGQGSCGNCGYIKFQEQAFDQLVLAEDKKELIRAVARNAGGGSRWDYTEGLDEFSDEDDDDEYDADNVGIDVIANKGAASIFLLSGPPGTGKTLTAEAIAELLRKPLYIVTAGDLGITASEVEKTLGSVLDLCQTWDALVLIDEADVFLEARDSTEIQRNALVCVMLRLLEYYSGCLFLSSNRSAASIDAAIASRITVMLTYPPLETEGRAKVWKNLIELVPALPVDPTTGLAPERISRNPRKASKYRMHFTDSEYDALASGYQLNGRQIKNSIVLARALAKERGVPLSLEVLHRAVTAVAGEAATIMADKGSY